MDGIFAGDGHDDLWQFLLFTNLLNLAFDACKYKEKFRNF